MEELEVDEDVEELDVEVLVEPPVVSSPVPPSSVVPPSPEPSPFSVMLVPRSFPCPMCWAVYVPSPSVRCSPSGALVSTTTWQNIESVS